jgi:hypothetical protein
MLGETLSVEDKLKLSGTKLLAAMEGGDAAAADDADEGGDEGDEAVVTRSRKMSGAEATTLSAINLMLGQLGTGEDPEGPAGDDDDAAAAELAALEAGDLDSEDLELEELGEPEPDDHGAGDGKSLDKGEPQPYTCELEYLNDQFSMVLQQVQQANLRLDQELKESGTKDNQPRWMRDDNGGGKKRSIGTPTATIFNQRLLLSDTWCLECLRRAHCEAQARTAQD